MIFVIFAKALPEWFYKSYYHCFTAIKLAKPSWRSPQSMIPFIANPTKFVEKYRAARIYSPWRFLPPRNTPDSFCRLLHPTKSIAMLHGRYFSFTGNAPWQFHELSERDTDFSSTLLHKQGQELRSEQTVIPLHEQHHLYLFLRLNNSETFVENAFWAQR